MCSVCENTYLLHPSEDNVILFWKFLKMILMMKYDAMMMQYAKDVILVRTITRSLRVMDKSWPDPYPLNRGLPTFFNFTGHVQILLPSGRKGHFCQFVCLPCSPEGVEPGHIHPMFVLGFNSVPMLNFSPFNQVVWAPTVDKQTLHPSGHVPLGRGPDLTQSYLLNRKLPSFFLWIAWKRQFCVFPATPTERVGLVTPIHKLSHGPSSPPCQISAYLVQRFGSI